MKLATRTFSFQLLGTALLAIGTALPAWADYESTVLSQGPVGYWRLNETTQPQPTAQAANLGSLGNSASGAYNNYPERGVAGPFAGSSAVGLSGSLMSVSTPWQADLNTAAFSVEAWVNPAIVPNFAYVMSSAQLASPRSGWYLAQDDGSTFGAGSAFVVRFFNQNGTTPTVQLAAPISLPVGSWYHLVLTYDGTTATLYQNGVAVTNRAAAYVPNVSAAFTVGSRSDNNFYWPGQAAEVAMYSAALSAAQVAAHYTAGTTAPTTYASTVQGNTPLLYWRFAEAPDPVAANLGSLGSQGNGLYIYNAKPDVAGPRSPTLAGFDAANKAVGFSGDGGVVRIPPLNLNTNTVTMSAWINAKGAQAAGTGLVFSRGGSPAVNGLNIDGVSGGLGLGYTWNDDDNSKSWSPSEDGLPTLPDSQWAFAALVVSPNQATVYIGDPTKQDGFAAVTNPNLVDHVVQSFDVATLLGADPFAASRSLNGALDEVAIFGRSLSRGEVFSQYATGLGSLAPRIFAELEASPDPVVGNPLVLMIDAGGTQPLTYSWHRAGLGIATTTNGVLTIASASAGDSGTYDVTITNSVGTVTSAQVVVVVNQATAPVISELRGFQDRTLYPGGTLSLEVVATGGGLNYQWYKASAPIASATTSAYSIPSVTNSDAGSYTVTITNALGTVSAGPVVITIPTVVAASYESLVVGSAPEAWWRLDEAAGSVKLWDGMGRHDGSYESLNATVPPVVLGAAGAIAGSANTAASFSPANQGVGVIPYSSDLNSSVFTYEGWVKTTVLNDPNLVPFSSSFGDTGLHWQTTPTGFWNPGDPGGYDLYGNGNTATPIVSGAWTHLVMSYDATRVISGTHYPWTFYVNGVTDGFVWTGNDANSGGPFIIGGRGVDANTLADRFFDGQVDEVAVYKRELSESEITAHFQARFGVSTVPYFSGEFLPQTVTTGRNLSYTTTVLGTLPITLQWYKDSSPISGATNSSLAITNTVVSDTGTYTLWATNVAGVSSQSVAVTVISPVNYANVTNSLALHLRFDGDTTDSSGRGNNGTQQGSPTFVTGLIGPQALNYVTETNGATPVAVTSASYVDLGKPADLQFGSATSFTIGLWVKVPTNSDGGDLPFIGNAINSMNNPGWVLGPTYYGGGWQWCLGDVTNIIDVNGADGSINDGGWHNFVLTVDRTAKIAHSYLDGMLMASRDIALLGSVDTDAAVTIGQDPTGLYPEAWTVTLDDIGIWRKALTALEVTQIHSAGITSGSSFDTVGTASVTITMIVSGSSVTLSWPTGTLQQSDTLGASANWTAVPGASAPSYTFTPGTGNKFYRVQL